jgi:hypothetical protein
LRNGRLVRNASIAAEHSDENNWHETDLQRPHRLGPQSGALQKVRAEGLFSEIFQTCFGAAGSECL